MCVIILSGCNDVRIKPTPNALFYTYLIAHGMVYGKIISGEISAAEFAELLRADQKSLLAIKSTIKNPSDKKTIKTIVDFLSILN